MARRNQMTPLHFRGLIQTVSLTTLILTAMTYLMSYNLIDAIKPLITIVHFGDFLRNVNLILLNLA